MVEQNMYLNSSKEVILNNNLEISNEEFVSQAKIDEAMAVVDSLDFTPISFKLEAEYAWSKESLTLALPLYKQWLVLQSCYDDYSIAPSTFVDEYWHTHILDTRKYMEDCQLVFGEYLHHFPYFGLRNEQDAKELSKGFELTKKLYKHHFGVEYLGDNVKEAGCGRCSGGPNSCR
jgi:hypothetical protein